MKFRLVKELGEHMTVGKIYTGQVCVQTNYREHGLPKVWHEIVVCVQNDNGIWLSYWAGNFETIS